MDDATLRAGQRPADRRPAGRNPFDGAYVDRMPMDGHDIAVVIPALNESLRIRGVVEGALQHCPRVIVQCRKARRGPQAPSCREDATIREARPISAAPPGSPSASP